MNPDFLKSITEEDGSLYSDGLKYNKNSLMGRTQDITQDAIYSKRDPEEEFFMLSVLALKLLHTEEFDYYDYIYQVNAGVFWKEVKESDLPFHQWYRWLEKKLFDLRRLGLEHKNSLSEKKSETSETKNPFAQKEIITPRSKGKGLFSRFFGNKDKKVKFRSDDKPEDDF